MIKDTPNYWGNPLLDEFKTRIEPLNQALGKQLVARSCSVPNCGHVATWDEFCDRHLVEINEAYQQWEDWKVTNALETYFLPYEQLSE